MHETDVDDNALVRRASEGDHDALEQLIGRHQGWVYNVAVRVLAHPQDAEDATQEIFIKMVMRLSSFESRLVDSSDFRRAVDLS